MLAPYRGIGEVGRDLVDFEDFTILETGLAQALDITRAHTGRIPRELACIDQSDQFATVKGRREVIRVQRRTDGAGSRITSSST